MQGDDQDSNVTELDVWPEYPVPYLGVSATKARRHLEDKVKRVEGHAFSKEFRAEAEMDVFIKFWRIPHPNLANRYYDDSGQFISDAKQITRLV